MTIKTLTMSKQYAGLSKTLSRHSWTVNAQTVSEYRVNESVSRTEYFGSEYSGLTQG